MEEEVTISRKPQMVDGSRVHLVSARVDEAIIVVDGIETRWYVGSLVMAKRWAVHAIRWSSKNGNVLTLRRCNQLHGEGEDGA